MGNGIKKFEQLRNEISHKILNELFNETGSPQRKCRYGENFEKGKLSSLNSFFTRMSIKNIPSKFDEDEVFIQRCCNYLEENGHILVTRRIENNIVAEISFDPGGKGKEAYLTSFYLKKNKEQRRTERLQRGTIWNNRIAIIISLFTFFMLLFWHYK